MCIRDRFISYFCYAQNSSKIILGNGFDNQSEIFSKEYFGRTNDSKAALESDREESKSLVQPINTALSSSKREIREDRLGLNWSIGFGIGYSSHASSYFLDDGLRIKEFSGFRAVVLDTKIGWRFHESLAVFGTWKYSPGNATVSPYRSTYLGGGIAYHFGDSKQFSINGGLGKYQAKVGRNEAFGNCLLYTSPSPRDATLSRMPSSA